MMKLKQLSSREQLLAAVVISVLILGAYFGLRFVSAQQDITQLQKQAEATQRKLLKTRVPEEPREDIDSLAEELGEIEQARNLQVDELASVLTQLAPFDSQELKVRISQLARNSRVQIRVNEPFKTSPIAINQPKKKKKKVQEPTTDLILPATASWVMRMSEQSLFHRPLQRIELEGDYQSIQQFVYGLDNLPWLVNVLRLKVEKQPNLAPYGFNQPLVAELILAL